MDRLYFTIIDAATEAVKLSTAIVRNANYKREIMDATDQRIMDIAKAASNYLKVLQEVINIQEYVNVKHMPE